MMEFASVLDPSTFALMDLSLQGLYTWFKQQAEFVLFIILIALLITTVVKRAWISAVGVLVGLAVLGMFIWNPDFILDLSKWLADKLSL